MLRVVRFTLRLFEGSGEEEDSEEEDNKESSCTDETADGRRCCRGVEADVERKRSRARCQALFEIDTRREVTDRRDNKLSVAGSRMRLQVGDSAQIALDRKTRRRGGRRRPGKGIGSITCQRNTTCILVSRVERALNLELPLVPARPRDPGGVGLSEREPIGHRVVKGVGKGRPVGSAGERVKVRQRIHRRQAKVKLCSRRHPQVRENNRPIIRCAKNSSVNVVHPHRRDGNCKRNLSVRRLLDHHPAVWRSSRKHTSPLKHHRNALHSTRSAAASRLTHSTIVSTIISTIVSTITNAAVVGRERGCCGRCGRCGG